MNDGERQQFFTVLRALVTRGTPGDRNLLDKIKERLMAMPEAERSALLMGFLEHAVLTERQGDKTGVKDEVLAVLRGPDGEIKQTTGKGGSHG